MGHNPLGMPLPGSHGPPPGHMSSARQPQHSMEPPPAAAGPYSREPGPGQWGAAPSASSMPHPGEPPFVVLRACCPEASGVTILDGCYELQLVHRCQHACGACMARPCLLLLPLAHKLLTA